MVLAAGCMDIKMDFVVDSDGSGSLALDVQISKEWLATNTALQHLASEQGDSQEPKSDICEYLWGEEDFVSPPFLGSLASDPGFDVDVEYELGVDATEASCRGLARMAWPKEHADVVFDYLNDEDVITIERAGVSGWRMVLPIEPVELGEAEERQPGFPGFEDLVTFQFSLTLPGSPVEHNADRVSSGCDSSTFHWDFDVSESSGRPTAVTDGKDNCGGSWGAGPTIAVVLLGALVMSVGAVASINHSRRRRFGVKTEND